MPDAPTAEQPSAIRIRSVAFHEAGHAAFVLASQAAETLIRVGITPENPLQGGVTETTLDNERRCFPSDTDPEWGRRLSGPLVQVKFVPESIPNAIITDFQREILKTIGIRKLFEEVRSLGWESDLREFVSSLEKNLNSESDTSFAKFLELEETSPVKTYSLILANEDRLRHWIERQDVLDLIVEIGERLIIERELTGNQCAEILSEYPSVRLSIQETGFDSDHDLG